MYGLTTEIQVKIYLIRKTLLRNIWQKSKCKTLQICLIPIRDSEGDCKFSEANPIQLLKESLDRPTNEMRSFK